MIFHKTQYQMILKDKNKKKTGDHTQNSHPHEDKKQQVLRFLPYTHEIPIMIKNISREK